MSRIEIVTAGKPFGSDEMLTLISDPERKRKLQEDLQSKLKSALPYQEEWKVRSFAHGPLQLHTAGEGNLWMAFVERGKDVPVPRFENFFGILRRSEKAQTRTVEINIASCGDDAKVHGCFAEDSATREVWVMRDGTFNIQIEDPEVDVQYFADWSRWKKFSISGVKRSYFLVTKLDDQDIAQNVLRFVRKVDGYKSYVCETLGR